MPTPQITAMDSNNELNLLEQQGGMFKLYTQLCFCYPMPATTSPAAITATLTQGLTRLAAAVPWLAGQVVQESGIYKITPLDPIPQLVVKDLRADAAAPTWAALHAAQFPMALLDESWICPRNTLPDPDPAVNCPVLLLQATFIPGGLLLTVNSAHIVMDMTGQGTVMDMLSKACRHAPFTDQELAACLAPRKHLIPTLPVDRAWQPGPELDPQMVAPTDPLPPTGPDGLPPPAPPLPDVHWAYFLFAEPALTQLKQLATQDLAIPGFAAGFVSTDDALSAFIWQCVARARARRLAASRSIRFARAVDVRPFLGVDPLSPGVIQNMAYSSYTLQHLTAAPLGHVAATLRMAVDPATSDIAFATKSLATFLARTDDQDRISYTACVDEAADVMLSSWSKPRCYDVDFALGLGLPAAVRRPRFAPCESLFYLMPKDRQGGVAAALCLRDEDLARLRADATFVAHARYVG